MRGSRFFIISLLITAPALLVLAQVNRIDTFERGFRPHPAQGKIGSLPQLYPAPAARSFYINRVAYKALISGNDIASSPDWDASQPMPVGFRRLEQIARQQLARLGVDDDSWSIDGFELRSIASGQSLKWYFVVEMKPFWGAGPQGADPKPDSLTVYIDFSGKPGFIAPTQSR